MNLKDVLSKFMPFLFERPNQVAQEQAALKAQPSIPCVVDTLAGAEEVNLTDVLHAPGAEMAWQTVQAKLGRFDLVDGTGGVNPGDRRAIYYLIHYLKPASVLEIGTHIGASTLHIAAALSTIAGSDGVPGRLTSVDINDVNNTEDRLWLKYGSAMSPAEMMREMGFDMFVDFITRNSHNFLTSCQVQFDFIFLDGDHAASTVYQEVPAVLKLLKPGGVILLHDYFPGLKPLWSNGSLIPGPFLATERLCSEGARVHVLPLGELPWPTKLSSCVTSLALLLRD